MIRLVFAAALLALLATGCQTQSSPDQALDRAVEQMDDGYAELGKVANNLVEDNAKSATQHFNKAVSHFDKAITYLAQAVLPPEDQDAVTALKSAFAALERTLKALEKNDLDAAQRDYDDAQEYFEAAAILMD